MTLASIAGTQARPEGFVAFDEYGTDTLPTTAYFNHIETETRGATATATLGDTASRLLSAIAHRAASRIELHATPCGIFLTTLGDDGNFQLTAWLDATSPHVRAYQCQTPGYASVNHNAVAGAFDAFPSGELGPTRINFYGTTNVDIRHDDTNYGTTMPVQDRLQAGSVIGESRGSFAGQQSVATRLSIRHFEDVFANLNTREECTILELTGFPESDTVHAALAALPDVPYHANAVKQTEVTELQYGVVDAQQETSVVLNGTALRPALETAGILDHRADIYFGSPDHAPVTAITAADGIVATSHIAALQGGPLAPLQPFHERAIGMRQPSLAPSEHGLPDPSRSGWW